MSASKIKRYLILGLSLQVCCSALQTIGQTRFGLSRFSIKHREYKGIGYQEGYTTLGMFLSGQSPEVPFGAFLDGRAHVFNDTSFASNLGMGFRLGDQEQTYLFGMNSYYDMRWMQGLESHQLGLGLEILTRHIDLRVNAYKPFVGTFADEDVAFASFKGHHVLLRQHVTYALPMAEAEIGCTLPDPFDQVGLYLGLGGYYLFKQKGLMTSSGDTPGGKVRLYASPNPYVTLGADYSYDRLFKSRANGFISLNVPLGKVFHINSPKKKNTSWALIQGQDPVRQEIIPFYREKHQFTHKSPQGAPLQVLFVDNTFDGVGNGTTETPFSSLISAENASKEGDLIYVFYGDGTSRGYSEGFSFKNKQKLIGSGASFNLYGVKIPALTPEKLPLISSSNIAIKAICSNDIEMRGLHIQAEKDSLAFLNSFSSGVITQNTIEGGKNVPAMQIDHVQKELVFSFNTIQGGVSDLQAKGLIVIQGGEEKSNSLIHMHNNVFTCEQASNGLFLDNVFDQVLIQSNVFLSADPMGSAIASQSIAASELLGVHTYHDNKVVAGFNRAIHIDTREKAYIKSEIHGNILHSPTLTTPISIKNATPCSDVEILGNQIKASSCAIMLDTQAEESQALIKDNEVFMFTQDPAIHIMHEGEGNIALTSNTIDYAKRVKEAYPAFYLKIASTSKVLVDNNEVLSAQMPVSCLVNVYETSSKACKITLHKNSFSKQEKSQPYVILVKDPKDVHVVADEPVTTITVE